MSRFKWYRKYSGGYWGFAYYRTWIQLTKGDYGELAEQRHAFTILENWG